MVITRHALAFARAIDVSWDEIPPWFINSTQSVPMDVYITVDIKWQKLSTVQWYLLLSDKGYMEFIMSGQIFHQPRFPWISRGFPSFLNATFWVVFWSCEVAIMVTSCSIETFRSQRFGIHFWMHLTIAKQLTGPNRRVIPYHDSSQCFYKHEVG